MSSKAKSTKVTKGKAKSIKKDPKAAKKDPKAAKKAAKGGKSKPKDTKKGKNSKANAKGNKSNTKPAKKNTKAQSKAKGKGSKPKKEESKEQEYKAPMKVDIGPPIILPQTSEFVTKIAALKEFELKDDDSVEAVSQQFDAFLALLKQRKKDCLVHTRTLIVADEEDTPPVCIDIDGIKRMIANLGVKGAERDYAVMTTRVRCLDKIKELIAYEAKHATVTKQRERTSAAIIEKEIAEGEKVLAEAEPHLQRARDSLTKITKSSLDEIRALPNPHRLLIKTVKACAIMVGKPESELDGWANIKKLLKTTFVNSLVEFEARNITAKQRDLLQTEYLATDNDDIDDADKLTYENVNKANAVAGNLVTWIEAQLKYNEFIPKVEPMQARLKELAIELASIEGIVNKLDTALADLDKKMETARQEMRDNGRLFDEAVGACNA